MHLPARFIRENIAERGPIPFARFMELALYCPECGFYEKEGDNVGRGGAFYTSVSVGPLFGELLAFQFVRWLEEGGMPVADSVTLRLVEAGAHDGKLAADILGWLERQRPEVCTKLDYCILEPSVRRREWQKRTLAGYAARVRWLAGWDEYAGRDSQPAPRFTIIFSNELLDAMPVHRLGWDAKERLWFEWGVAVVGDRFEWARLPANPIIEEMAADALRFLPNAPELLEVLPHGYTIEASPAAKTWWGDAARSLQHGKLLTFDYGFDIANKFLPGRANGTVRAYRNHQLSGDVLADPGGQDITAHVDFPGIEAVGVAAGLKTELFESQGRFLTRIAAEAWKPENRFGHWDQKRTRQFQTLMHPQQLGQSFRVLVQFRR